MIIVTNNCQIVQLERFPFCQPEKNHEYQFILQDTANKETFLWEVFDMNEGKTPRMAMEICFPDDCMRQATYDYYLIKKADWELCQINIDYPAKSIYKTQNLFIVETNLFFVAGDKLVVLGKGETTPSGTSINKAVHILNRGLLKYMPCQTIPTCEYEQYTANTKKYIEYGN